jgi:hypothetical protein
MKNKFNLAPVDMRMVLLGVLSLCVFALALLGVGLGYTAIVRNNNTYNLAGVAPVRDLVIRAMDGLKSAPPLDPKTGDVYFPPTKYYLPAEKASMAGLTYAYDKDNGLSVSSKMALGQAVSAMYSAQNPNDLFAAMPYAQACQRGVRIVTTKQTEDELELKQTVSISGVATYLYAEKKCSGLVDVLDILKDLKTY